MALTLAGLRVFRRPQDDTLKRDALTILRGKMLLWIKAHTEWCENACCVVSTALWDRYGYIQQFVTVCWRYALSICGKFGPTSCTSVLSNGHTAVTQNHITSFDVQPKTQQAASGYNTYTSRLSVDASLYMLSNLSISLLLVTSLTSPSFFHSVLLSAPLNGR